MKDQRGGRRDQRTFEIKIRLSGMLRTEGIFVFLGDGRIDRREARWRNHANPLVRSSLNRADLLSWVDMGKTGTGFPAICQIYYSTNSMRLLDPFVVLFLHGIK